MNSVAQILRRHFGVDVAELHGVDVSRRKPARCGRDVTKGDVCAAALAIVDTFRGLGEFGWEGVDDLSQGEQGEGN